VVIVDRSSEAADLRDLVFFSQSIDLKDGGRNVRTILKKIRLAKMAARGRR
jgi:hypothetical protein